MSSGSKILVLEKTARRKKIKKPTVSNPSRKLGQKLTTGTITLVFLLSIIIKRYKIRYSYKVLV